ncbi:MAG: hypothetical protein GY822_07500 [Deltaproteobacteria bacterium]|nr:hypothetical protein [Deltaproteobacteria bacterium]
MWVVFGSVALFSANASHAASEPLKSAQEAYDDVNYQKCLKESAAALHTKASLKERVLTFRLRGLCAGALGDDELAAEMFAMMLALDASASLEKGMSPRISSAFLEAKGAWLDDKPLDVEIVSESLEDDVRVITLMITDLTDRVHELIAVDNQGVARPAVRSAARMEVEVPHYLKALHLVDEHGGILFQLSLNEKPPDESQVGSDVPGPSTKRIDDVESDPMPIILGVSIGAGTLLVVGTSVAVTSWILLSPSTVSLSSGISYAPQF